ncbi:hypothetical protein [Streptomyces prasinopilosus]|uniref:Uncharacterized protein n=1 Tax=Streptomyces prasinopilosus TaxID=67344 RepID=A0A1G6K539_9ACTN|nr:hypothetical protein [Streptomyces prasinopilosus]SDC26120.1 hypothetical protein SAMN05216505_101961 [Streptomyces prasinopilosus]
MERGGTTRPAVRGPGRPRPAAAPLPHPPALPRPRAPLTAALPAAALPAALVTVLVAVLAGGCGPSGSAAPRVPSSPPPSSSPSATAPEDVCARIVTHWARAVLDGTAYGDYQSMGLSNGQYDILRDAVAAARPVRERRGVPAAHAVIARHVREACAERHRTGRPGEGAWR